MKHLLKQLIHDEADASRQRNISREYLQGRILRSLQDQGIFSSWAFLGGTALRFLYALPRYSEDIDFSLTTPLPSDPFTSSFEKTVYRIQRDLRKETYLVDASIKMGSAVFSAAIKFRGLLYELDISPHQDEVLSIKVEVDTNPPFGTVTETTILRRFFLLNILHHDKSSLFAGKLNALLTRGYTKGRDIFDLVWYLSDPHWPPPNLTQLNNALKQFGWTDPELTNKNWPRLLSEKLDTLDWQQAQADVSPLLERPEDRSFIDKDVIMNLLQSRM
jgi:hypothetical protein